MNIIQGALTLLVLGRAAAADGVAPSGLRIPGHKVVPGALREDYVPGWNKPAKMAYDELVELLNDFLDSRDNYGVSGDNYGVWVRKCN